MNSIDVDNPSYYRSHPFRNQYNLPNSAFQNRDIQPSYSSIPQGKQHFQLTNKKHFVHKFNRSEIEEDNVLNEWYPQQDIQLSRIVMDKSYFRSLNVEDIEGAKPNTLISKAVKNRQKALNMLKRDELSHISQPGFNINNYGSQIYQPSPFINQQLPRANQSLVYQQNQAVTKFNRNKSIMQNNSMRILNNIETSNSCHQPNSYHDFKKDKFNAETQIYNNPPSKKQKTNYHFKYTSHTVPIPQNTFNNHEQQKSVLQRQVADKQQRIKQLQRQLYQKIAPQGSQRYSEKYHMKMETNDPKFQNRSYAYPQMMLSGNQKNLIEGNQQVYLKNELKSYNPYQNQQPNKQIPQISYLMNANKVPSHQFQTHENNNFKRANYNPSDNSSYQFPKPQLSNLQQQNSIHINSQNKYQNIEKSNIRKYNPTFLSFESEGFKPS